MSYLKPDQPNKGCINPYALLTKLSTVTSQSLGPQVEHVQVQVYVKHLENQGCP